jgi:hypothetical protein
MTFVCSLAQRFLFEGQSVADHFAAMPNPNHAGSFPIEHNDLTFFVELKQNGFGDMPQRSAAVRATPSN